jgi:hypothetical protein
MHAAATFGVGCRIWRLPSLAIKLQAIWEEYFLFALRHDGRPQRFAMVIYFQTKKFSVFKGI